MNCGKSQMTVGQNPELSEEISWQESAITGQVFMLKTGGLGFHVVFVSFQVCFPTFDAISFFNYQNSSSQTTGGIF
tara:strand:- start:555 stop:782 length:228 start_codon:yes stop_codon:yes gene_type:complete